MIEKAFISKKEISEFKKQYSNADIYQYRA